MKPVIFKDTLWQHPKNGKWYHKDKQLGQDEIEEYASQAESLRSIPLWRVLVNNGKLNAQTRMATAKTNDDKKDLVQIRRAQEYLQVIVDIENLLLNLKASSLRHKTNRE